MPIFRFSKAFGVGRDAKLFLNLQGGLTREAVLDSAHPEEQAKKLKTAMREQRQTLRKLRKKHQQIRQQRIEIFQLRNELDARNGLVETTPNVPAAPEVSGKPGVGALPDFVIIGAQKCGTATLYGLLTKHPYVQRAAVNEVHYFDNNFDKGIEWYRRHFPPPTWKGQLRSITGEKTPKYLFHPHAAERMAQVIPQARLIVLLRNPVDRAYSHYHHNIILGRDPGCSFPEAVEEQLWLLAEEHEPSEHERRSGISHGPPSDLLARGIYVDQLLRWRRFFGEEQMLVLKSEDFFEHTMDKLKLVQDFLGLPYRTLELESYTTKDRDPIDPITRRRLEKYYEPHNQRLYEYLGVDFGW